MIERAWIVVDLGFGDAGKGLLTDHLVRTTGAELVVRYNGGAQAGHNVVTPEGVHHTFAQFGAGTFAGARTWLSEHVVVHPTALLVEAKILEAKGVERPLQRIQVSDRARIVTPYHQALNRLRELARGPGRHGSCGVGIGETVAHALAHPGDGVLAADLHDPATLARKLSRVRDQLYAEVEALVPMLEAVTDRELVRRERAIFEVPSVGATWMEQLRPVEPRVVRDERLGHWFTHVRGAVFEGAQGVLLDEDHGFHPHTTWSKCTSIHAEALVAAHATFAREAMKSAFDIEAPAVEVETIGVLRSHMVRHGAGPLPTEDARLGAKITEHNAENPWQGRVRYGWLDLVLARYALEVSGKVDHLAITHLDLLPKLDEVRLCRRYAGIDGLAVQKNTDIAEQEKLTRILENAKPEFEPLSGEAELLARIEADLARPVTLVAHGPRSTDVAEHRR